MAADVAICSRQAEMVRSATLKNKRTGTFENDWGPFFSGSATKEDDDRIHSPPVSSRGGLRTLPPVSGMDQES
jgi:hypothetical protein